MKKKYGLFLDNGDRVNYSSFGGNGLVKLNVASCDTKEELVQFIENSDIFSPNSHYYILEYWEYTKSYRRDV